MSRALLSVVDGLDGIYQRVMSDPSAVREGDLMAWAAEALNSLDPPTDRRIAREARRVVRMARRLADFWGDPSRAGRAPDDWRSAVDEALGSRGWQPTLDIIRLGLEEQPTPELFEEMQYRFAVVHFRPWMDGVEFEDYLAQREADGG